MRKTVSLAQLKPNVPLRFLYNTAVGRGILQLLIRPGFSRAAGAVLSSRASVCLIPSFIRRNGIDMSRYQETDFDSYNAFFTRKIRQSCVQISPDGLMAPCDSRLTAYPIDEHAVFSIKGSEYSLEEMLQDAELAKAFAGGMCLIFRLEVQDYHRYCYFDDCVETSVRKIPGVLHTVQPVAFHRYPVYHRNSREVTVLDTEHFGMAVQVEVGALCVGKIQNHHQPGRHLRGEEKGMFLFGGSTVVLLLQNCQVDEEILENTRNNLETLVTLGERIGQ